MKSTKYSKEQLTDLIDVSVEQLIAINKDTDGELYRIKITELSELIYYFCCDFSGIKDIEHYSCELLESIKISVGSYEIDKGKFLNYFITILKHKIGETKTVEQNSRNGIRISINAQKMINKILKLVDEYDLNLNFDSDIKFLSETLNLDVAKIKDLIRINRETYAISNEVETEDGSVDLFDSIKSTKTVEQNIIEKENVITLLNNVNVVYNKLRCDTKSVTSKLLTIKILNSIYDFDENELVKYDFLDEDIFKIYCARLTIPTQEELSIQLGKYPESLSRTYNTFKDKYYEYLSELNNKGEN